MSVQRLHTHAVIDDDGVAVNPELAGKHDLASIARQHRRIHGFCKIEAEMHLSVYLLTSIEVGAVIGKGRFDLRTATGLKCTLPQDGWRRLFRQRSDGLVVHATKIGVDLQKRLERIVGRHLQLWRALENRRYYPAKKFIVQRNRALAEGLRKN